jgi:2-amino-4-ketopentanoate thiolase alpha subunit
MTAKKGDWVRIHKIVMKAGGRAPQVPEDTAKVSFEMWQKGFLLNNEAKTGSIVDIETVIGRNVTGTLMEVNPYFTHSFGKCVPEILKIDKQLKDLMKESIK